MFDLILGSDSSAGTGPRVSAATGPGQDHLVGEAPLFGEDFDDRCFLMTMDELATGWVQDDRDRLPDLESIAPGPFLAALLEHLDRRRLNGHDVVRLLQSRERQNAHAQAEAMADIVELSHSAPGDSHSDVERLRETFEFASDEIRAALTLTRWAAQARLSLAIDLRERLPQVWDWLSQGVIDMARARVICDGTAHLSTIEACHVVELVGEKAPSSTTGQLAAELRRLCVESDPDEAKRRHDRAHEDRRVVIEANAAGTASLFLLDIAVADARAIGRRVNCHMLSLDKEDRSGRTHDQLRADITVDLLLGADPANRGRGLVDVRVGLATLAGLDDAPGEIGGMGPVIADVARQVADRQHKAEWRVTITDDRGNIVDIVTTRRRPTRNLSRLVEATQPTCVFPGCRMPARECDFDHVTAWSSGGETSASNGSPKCRHDHRLKDHGWTHQRTDGHDVWTSPLGHTYMTRGRSP